VPREAPKLLANPLFADPVRPNVSVNVLNSEEVSLPFDVNPSEAMRNMVRPLKKEEPSPKVSDRDRSHEACSVKLEDAPSEAVRDFENPECSEKLEVEPRESINDLKNESFSTELGVEPIVPVRDLKIESCSVMLETVPIEMTNVTILPLK
jgi:hypothetical protein